MTTAAKISFGTGILVGILAMLFFVGARQVEETPPPEATEEILNESPPPPPIVEEVSVSAAGAYALTGEELYSFRADKRWPIASITKLMTALIASEEFESNEVITITEKAIVTEGNSGFAVGEKYYAEDLIEAMLLISSNDAATALAIHYGEDAFIDRMNERAGELGMTNTSFRDPTGLSFQNLSSVEDLRKLALYIWENDPQIFRTTTQKTGMLTEVQTGRRKTVENINTFAGRGDFLGGKTGRIPEAEGNLLSIFKTQNREPTIIVVLGTKDRFKETEAILNNL